MDYIAINNYKHLDYVDIWKFIHETMLATKYLSYTDIHSYTLIDL